MKQLLKALSSPILMTFLLVLLIVVLAMATFIENDFGTEVARMRVYNTLWFEIILALLGINLTARSFSLKLYKARKFSMFLFHIAFVIMIIGAGVTRYIGYEGSMHIREGESSSTLILQGNELSASFIVNGTRTTQKADFAAGKDQHFSTDLAIGDQQLTVKLSEYYPQAVQKAIPSEKGSPLVGFVLAGEGYRGLDYMASGTSKQMGRLSIAFNADSKADITIETVGDSLVFHSEHTVFVSAMGGASQSEIATGTIAFQTGKLYKINGYNFVLQEYLPKGQLVAAPTTMQGHRRGMQALVFDVNYKGAGEELILWENQWNRSQQARLELDGATLELSYGYKTMQLPFELHLDDFVIDRYPGSMSPSSFSSYVQLIEANGQSQPYHIYMNNILKYGGYRFFQSSYDQDEKGTILSVNHDQWGTGITYLSYFLLIVGILWSMVNSASFFRNTKLRDKSLVLILLLSVFSFTQAGATETTSAQRAVEALQNEHSSDFEPVDKQHAEKFGTLLIQNNTGRTEPIYTYSSELLRKIARKEKMMGLTPVQLFMEMNMHPEYWLTQPIIRVKNDELEHFLGIHSDYVAYSDLVTPQGGYKLQQLTQTVFAKPPVERDKFDKAVIKTDEKVNICFGIFAGNYLRILPVPGAADSTRWYPPSEARLLAVNAEDSLFLSNIVSVYFDEVQKAKTTGDYTVANEYLDGLIRFQEANAAYELPSDFKTEVEIMYYKYNPFQKLFPFYATAGLIFLILLLVFIIIGKELPKFVSRSFYWIMLLAFAFHTFGIIARWYVSGHAPMSNGYESMIFISWVTILAGFLFNGRSPFVLTATAVLAGLTLMVANLSFMDPQITNLVPVLQSYWLTIHVSVITASYGFLGLGALLGIINLLLFIFKNKENQQRISSTIENLTIINHKSLIAGLYLLTIGTFLGAVWANESWGRYWGWDPKETWALISILVYTIVTHARLIPGLKGIFVFNVLALYGFASILMTYFGVNYYLSGLHSYAGGDPVPVPVFVYYTVSAVLLLSLAAAWRHQKFIEKTKAE